MDVQHIESLLYYWTHFLVWFKSCKRYPTEELWPQTRIGCSLIQNWCAYTASPNIHMLFGVQLRMTIETHVPYDCVLHTKWWLYCQRCIVLKEQSWLVTLHVAVSSINRVH